MINKNRKLALFAGILMFALAACAPGTGGIPESGVGQIPQGETPTAETPAVPADTPEETTETPEFATSTPAATDETPATATEMPTATPGGADQLVNSSWVLESFGPVGSEEPVISGSTVTLEFMPEGQAGGQGGCNSFGTQYEIVKNEIDFEPVTSTLMACAEEEVTGQEAEYYQALEAANAFELEDDRLTILYDDGSGVLNFVRSGADVNGTPAAGLLCGASPDQGGSAWKVCQSRAYGFEVEYPPDAVLLDETDISARVDLPVVPGTNLSEKYLQIDVTENAEGCSSPLAAGYAPGMIPTEEVLRNDVVFLIESGSDAGAGNYYDWTAYSTSQNGTCVSLSFVLHSTQRLNYPTPPPEFDVEEESQVFEEIVSTFRWLTP